MASLAALEVEVVVELFFQIQAVLETHQAQLHHKEMTVVATLPVLRTMAVVVVAGLLQQAVMGHQVQAVMAATEALLLFLEHL
jgi:uncharacterized protein YaaN involved in tellurite resistance